MKKIDVRGLNCPEPVVRVKKVMESDENQIDVLTDAQVAVENITRLCNKMKYSVEVDKNNDEFVLHLVR